MTLHPRVVVLTDAEAIHPFDSDPYFLIGRSMRASVDLFPAYPHDAQLVSDTLAHVDKLVGGRVLCKPTIYLLPYEEKSRTNGWAYAAYPYPRPPVTEPPFEGVICLPGKRIPIHPAMTRYVVAHEYGHHVEYEILRRRGLDLHKHDIAAEYAKVRGCDPHIPYGGRRWHATAGELFANDFRILVCDIEPEFWPHAGFAHPSRCAKARRWWEKHWESA